MKEKMQDEKRVLPYEMYERLLVKNLGAAVKRARETVKMSQSELARSTGKTQAQISLMESGEVTPDVGFLLTLSYLSGFTIGELTGEPCADWVGRSVWVHTGGEGGGNPNEPSKLTYTKMNVLAVSSSTAEIFMSETEGIMRMESEITSDSFTSSMVIEGQINYSDIHAYKLGGSAFRRKRQGYIGEVQDEILFFPRRRALSAIMSNTRPDGGCTRIWYVPKDDSFRFFDPVGRLLPIITTPEVTNDKDDNILECSDCGCRFERTTEPHTCEECSSFLCGSCGHPIVQVLKDDDDGAKIFHCDFCDITFKI
jgi:transcriptional regulator with XRE-family HTH domain